MESSKELTEKELQRVWGGKGWRSTLGERSLESTGELRPDVKGLSGGESWL